MKQINSHILRTYIAPERLTLGYAILTSLLTLILWPWLDRPGYMLLQRAAIIGLIFVVHELWLRYPQRPFRLLRTLIPLALLTYWYPDTFQFCSVFGNLDHVFAQAEQTLFGCQPAVVFPQKVTSTFWSEAFHLGYFSYFPLILTVCLLSLNQTPTHGLDHWTPENLSERPVNRFEWVSGVVLAAFFLYYIIFLFLPVAGPQFYFQAIGPEAVATGHFPAIGYYFRSHVELTGDVNQLPAGFFQMLVDWAHKAGERPTAAFPSSHVGVGTIVLWFFFRLRRTWGLAVLPLWLLLCVSTVYLQAHYLIDALVGLLTAPVFLVVARWLTNHCTPQPIDQPQN